MTQPAGSRPTGNDDITDRADIEELVRAFYRDVATDGLLGPVFEGADVHWPSHIDTLTRFWSWQLLGQPGYDGNPLLAHAPIHRDRPFTDAHFERWLDLFTSTVDGHFTGPVADTAKHRAAKMARALQRLLDGRDEPADNPITPHLRRPPSPTRLSSRTSPSSCV
jgi:hemoglobin